MHGKSIVALAVAASTLLAVAQFGCFRILGPPSRWGTDVVVKVPIMETHPPTDLASQLAHADDEGPVPDSELTLSLPASVAGKPFHRDTATHCNLELLQTHTGPQWGDGQHFYARHITSSEWTEFRSTSRIVAAQATVICPGGRPSVLLVRWHPWFPYRETYARFLQSVFDRPLRSEWGVYRLAVEDDELRFLFPGSSIVPSPDRRYIAYLASTNDLSGFHNVLVYDVDRDRSLRVLSLWEADPGSGPSFAYRWSGDSKALRISGRARGWSARADHITDLHLAFVPDTGQLFSVGDQNANFGLNPTAARVTTLAGQASRHSGRGLGVR